MLRGHEFIGSESNSAGVAAHVNCLNVFVRATIFGPNAQAEVLHDQADNIAVTLGGC
jgi:hypothetical protein